MSNNISDNDDDLFDDLPKDKSSSSSAGKILEDLDFDNIITKEDFEGSAGLRLAMSFHSATKAFTYNSSTNALQKSVEITLNSLTNGAFSKFVELNYLEQRISRLSDIISVLEIFIEKSLDPSEKDPVILDIIKKLGLNIDKKYIDIYFVTHLNILIHNFALAKASYLSLCNQLEIQPEQSLLGSPKEVSLNSEEVISLNNYVDTNFKNILLDVYSDSNYISNISQIMGDSNIYEIVRTDVKKED